MEKILKKEIDELPEAKLQFDDIKFEDKKAKVVLRRPWVQIAAVIAVILVCATTVYAAVKSSYGLWSGIHSNAYADVQILNWKYDCNLPKTLSGLQFTKTSTYYGAPQGATHLEALIAPTYAMHNVDYGDYSGIQQEDGSVLWTGKQIGISFGTTENGNWKYHFSVAEDGSCNYEGVQPGSQSVLEYKGYTLYLYTIIHPSVRWEDHVRNLVIDVTCYGYDDSAQVVEIAKELIDLNAP